MFNDGIQNVSYVEDLIVTGTEGSYQTVLFSSLTDTDDDTPSFSNTPFVEAFSDQQKELIVKDITPTQFSIAMSNLGVVFASVTGNLIISGT